MAFASIAKTDLGWSMMSTARPASLSCDANMARNPRTAVVNYRKALQAFRPCMLGHRNRPVGFTHSARPNVMQRPARQIQAGNNELVVDEDFLKSLNEVSSKAVRVMLSENTRQIEEFFDELDSMGQSLVQDGEIETARYMLVLQAMLRHKVHPEAERLQPVFQKAFQKVGGLLEDSGWKLEFEGKGGSPDMIDEELIPPTAMGKYE